MGGLDPPNDEVNVEGLRIVYSNAQSLHDRSCRSQGFIRDRSNDSAVRGKFYLMTMDRYWWTDISYLSGAKEVPWLRAGIN